MDRKKINDFKFKCCICGNTYIGYGNNPEPVKSKGRCCDDCNMRYIVPARIMGIMPRKEDIKDVR